MRHCVVSRWCAEAYRRLRLPCRCRGCACGCAGTPERVRQDQIAAVESAVERQVESLVADMVAARQRLQQDSLKCRALANAIRAVLGVPLVDTGASWVPSLHVCMQAPVRVLVMPCRASWSCVCW